MKTTSLDGSNDTKFFKIHKGVTKKQNIEFQKGVWSLSYGAVPQNDGPLRKLDFFLESMLINGYDFENMGLGPYRNGSKGMLL